MLDYLAVSGVHVLPCSPQVQNSGGATTMKVTWSELGKPTKPGRYIYQDCEVVVDPNAIQIWRKYPNAVFTLRFTDLWDGTRRASLGDYEVPGGKSPDGKPKSP